MGTFAKVPILPFKNPKGFYLKSNQFLVTVRVMVNPPSESPLKAV